MAVGFLGRYVIMKKGSKIILAAAFSAFLLAGCSLKINLGGSGDSSSNSSAVADTSGSGAGNAEVSASTGTSMAMPEVSASSEAASNAGGSSTASTSDGEITEEKALSIAYEHAGVTADEVYNVQVEREQENGNPVFKAEFETEAGEYEYEILRSDGRIYETDYELKKEWVYAQPEDSVTIDEAAQKIADLTGAAAEDVNIWQEGGDGRAHYEGNVSYNGVYYEFELDPETNIIYEWSAKVQP